MVDEPEDDWSDRQRHNWYRRRHRDVATCIRALGECPECMEAFGMKRIP